MDTSGLTPSKTISVDDGAFAGTLFIESSNDGQVSAAPVNVATFIGSPLGPPVSQDVTATLQFMRVRRAGSTSGPAGAPSVNVGGASTRLPAMVGALPFAASVQLVDQYAAAGVDANYANVVHPNDAGYASIAPVVTAGIAPALAAVLAAHS